MRQLILLAFLGLLPIQALPAPNFRVLILDDCTTWEFKDYSQPGPDLKKSDTPRFFFTKIELKTNDYISVSHTGVSFEGKTLSLDLTYPEILSHNPVYTSKLSLEDWFPSRSLIQVPQSTWLCPQTIALRSDLFGNKNLLFTSFI
jgi:hypothetical protein